LNALSSTAKPNIHMKNLKAKTNPIKRGKKKNGVLHGRQYNKGYSF
jgi:hypothetical protein